MCKQKTEQRERERARFFEKCFETTKTEAANSQRKNVVYMQTESAQQFACNTLITEFSIHLPQPQTYENKTQLNKKSTNEKHEHENFVEFCR